MVWLATVPQAGQRQQDEFQEEPEGPRLQSTMSRSRPERSVPAAPTALRLAAPRLPARPAPGRRQAQTCSRRPGGAGGSPGGAAQPGSRVRAAPSVRRRRRGHFVRAPVAAAERRMAAQAESRRPAPESRPGPRALRCPPARRVRGRARSTDAQPAPRPGHVPAAEPRGKQRGLGRRPARRTSGPATVTKRLLCRRAPRPPPGLGPGRGRAPSC